MQQRYIIGWVLVLTQMLCIGILVWPVSHWLYGQWTLVPAIIGIVIGLLAVWEMRSSKLRVHPAPAKGAILIASGVYAYVRHPMYTAVLLVTVSGLWGNYNFFRLCVWLLLVAVLVYKLTLEEQMLQQQFAEYQQYQKHTYRLLPWLY